MTFFPDETYLGFINTGISLLFNMLLFVTFG